MGVTWLPAECQARRRHHILQSVRAEKRTSSSIQFRAHKCLCLAESAQANSIRMRHINCIRRFAIRHNYAQLVLWLNLKLLRKTQTPEAPIKYIRVLCLWLCLCRFCISRKSARRSPSGLQTKRFVSLYGHWLHTPSSCVLFAYDGIIATYNGQAYRCPMNAINRFIQTNTPNIDCFDQLHSSVGNCTFSILLNCIERSLRPVAILYFIQLRNYTVKWIDADDVVEKDE